MSNKISVHVQFFSRLRELAGVSEIDLRTAIPRPSLRPARGALLTDAGAS